MLNRFVSTATLVLLASTSESVFAQQPKSPGQAAFATVTEVVAILKADPTTDWSKVNLDALREHLVDMNDVVLNASVTKKDVDEGGEMTVTGTRRNVDAIRRMLTMHS